jgi:hypothetical protein
MGTRMRGINYSRETSPRQITRIYSRHLSPLLSFLSEWRHRAPLLTHLCRLLPPVSQSVTKIETRKSSATKHTVAYQHSMSDGMSDGNAIHCALDDARRLYSILRICGRTHIRHRLGALASVGTYTRPTSHDSILTKSRNYLLHHRWG